MKKVRMYRNSRAEMSVEQLDEYYVVHMDRSYSLDLMKKVYSDYKSKPLMACIPTGSKINRIARLFGELVMTSGQMNIYHIKGD